MKRITAVFPTLAEAEATSETLRSLNLVQGAIILRADSSHQVNSSADNSHSGSPHSDTLAVEAVPIVGGLGGLAEGAANSMGAGPASAYAAAALSVMPSTHSDSSTKTESDKKTDLSVSKHIPASSTLEGLGQAGFMPEEAQYYSSAIAQGHAVLSVDLESDEHEAFVRQAISQNQGHPFMGTPA